jgi:hypothetical protein
MRAWAIGQWCVVAGVFVVMMRKQLVSRKGRFVKSPSEAYRNLGQEESGTNPSAVTFCIDYPDQRKPFCSASSGASGVPAHLQHRPSADCPALAGIVLTFNVAIQAGAILAVVIYWRRLWNMVVGFAQADNRDYLSLSVAPDHRGGWFHCNNGTGIAETVAPIAWA